MNSDICKSGCSNHGGVRYNHSGCNDDTPLSAKCALYYAHQDSTQSHINQIQPFSASVTSAKEYFVPLGTGSSTADDWADVADVTAYLNTSSYYNIQKAVFETSVKAPDKQQIVSARLYNTTSKHPVWLSEQTFPSGHDKQLLISKPITLDPDNKLYTVQIKTQLKYSTTLDLTRIHIYTK